MQIAWLLVIFAKNPYYLYVSRILCGYVGGAAVVCVPIFITEISYDR